MDSYVPPCVLAHSIKKHVKWIDFIYIFDRNENEVQCVQWIALLFNNIPTVQRIKCQITQMKITQSRTFIQQESYHPGPVEMQCNCRLLYVTK